MKRFIKSIGALSILYCNHLSADIYFVGYYEVNKDFAKNGILKTDGTKNGTVHITNAVPNGINYINTLFSFNGKLYYTGKDSSYHTNLYVYDGSNASQAFDLNTNGDDNIYENFAKTSTHIFFIGRDSNNKLGLFAYDGENPPVKLMDIYTHFTYAKAIGDTIYLNVGTVETGSELYKSDGTVAGTSLIKDINPGPNTGVTEINIANGKIFMSSASSDDFELWISNGTTENTVLLKDINSAGSSSLQNFITIGDELYFTANDGSSQQIWKSDGTMDGTVKVTNAEKGIYEFVYFKNKLLFPYDDGTNGEELWSYDSNNGMNMVYNYSYKDDIKQGLKPSFSNNNLLVTEDKFYFKTENYETIDGLEWVNDFEPYVYDGLNPPTKIDILEGTYNFYDGDIGKEVNTTKYSNATNFVSISFNTAPIVSNLQITGTAKVGKTLTGSYTFNDDDNDTESGSTFKWYRADDNNGTNASEIIDANSTTYTVTTTDGGKYLVFGVTPNDGTSAGSEVNSSYTTQVPIVVDLSSVVTANKWSMIAVPAERNVSVVDIPNAPEVWTYTTLWEKPTTLEAEKGYWLYTQVTTGYNNISATVSSSSRSLRTPSNQDYETIKAVSDNNWTMVGISHTTDGISWSDIYNPSNTKKSNCQFTYIFHYDSANGSWNTTTKVPYLGAIWIRQNNCQNDN